MGHRNRKSQSNFDIQAIRNSLSHPGTYPDPISFLNSDFFTVLDSDAITNFSPNPVTNLYSDPITVRYPFPLKHASALTTNPAHTRRDGK
jgi:hypothetical protein